MADSARNSEFPVEFFIDQVDLVSSSPPDPVFEMARESSYVHVVAAKAAAYLEAFALPDGRGVWFEYSGFVIPWHRPMGVIRDALAGRSNVAAPMRISVRFRNCPFELPKLSKNEPNEKCVRRHHASQQKMASALFNGNARAFQELSVEKINRLWEMSMLDVNGPCTPLFNSLFESPEIGHPPIRTVEVNSETMQIVVKSVGVAALATTKRPFRVRGVEIDNVETLPMRELITRARMMDGFLYVHLV